VTTLDPALLAILACPCEAHGPLEYDAAAAELACTVCDRVYRVEDGIPVLLLDEARRRGTPADPGR
jgi:hypothetical protein